jgi:uncharacterized membrane protein
MGIRGFLTTLGLGAGAMYFYDPELGERRRAMLRDQWTTLQGNMTDLWSAGTQDLQTRAQSFQFDMRARATGQTKSDGMAGVMSMGNGAEWSPGARLLALSGGGAVTLYGLLRGGISGKLVMLAGLNLVSRGMFDKGLMSVVKPASQSGVAVQKDMQIDAPVEEVFDFWRNYDNFPRFMSHLDEVRDTGEGRSHWVAKGPADTQVEWDATITQMEPNRVIAWESVPGSQVYTAGRVRFTRAGAGTHLNVYMTYSPPGGPVGHAVAVLFGADAQTALDEDLGKLKALLERRESGSARRSSTGGSRPTAALGPTGGSQSGSAKARSTDSGKAGSGSGSSTTNRDSGQPGGGQGRKDVVGGTGVYPASGPLPEGDAETQGMASWGQGERGAAGYEDSGSSELSFDDVSGVPEAKKPGSKGSGGKSGSGK